MKVASAIVAAAALLAAPALAQQAPGGARPAAFGSPMCVYDGLSDWAIVQLSLESLDRKAENPAKLKSEIDYVAKICTDRFGWDDKRRAAALLTTKYVVVVGALTADLEAAGFRDGAALLAVLDALPDADYAKLIDEGWRTDKTMQGRVRTALVARGVPDKPELIEKAMTIIANYALSDVVTGSWDQP